MKSGEILGYLVISSLILGLISPVVYYYLSPSFNIDEMKFEVNKGNHSWSERIHISWENWNGLKVTRTYRSSEDCLEIEDISEKSINIELNVGEVKLLGESRSTRVCGEITVERDGKQIKFTGNSGSIEVYPSNEISIKIGVGKVSFSEAKAESVEIELGMGEIDGNAEIKDLRLEIGSGSLNTSFKVKDDGKLFISGVGNFSVELLLENEVPLSFSSNSIGSCSLFIKNEEYDCKGDFKYSESDKGVEVRLNTVGNAEIRVKREE
ncbi:hypothetical protein DRN46_01115 [Thermococci archaeon]|nr:MAG: hypothetical protein DRN46_01115 [Thermococci archaeon]